MTEPEQEFTDSENPMPGLILAAAKHQTSFWAWPFCNCKATYRKWRHFVPFRYTVEPAYCYYHNPLIDHDEEEKGVTE